MNATSSEVTPAMLLSSEQKALEEFKLLDWWSQRNRILAAQADPHTSGVLLLAYRQLWSPKE